MIKANDQPENSSAADFYATMDASRRVVGEAKEARRKRLSISIPSKAAISIVLSCVVFAIPAALGAWSPHGEKAVTIDDLPLSAFFILVNAIGIYNLISLYLYNTGVDETPTDIDIAAGEDSPRVMSTDEKGWLHIVALVVSVVVVFTIFRTPP